MKTCIIDNYIFIYESLLVCHFSPWNHFNYWNVHGQKNVYKIFKMSAKSKNRFKSKMTMKCPSKLFAVPNHATKVLHRCQKPPNCNFASVSIWPNSQRGSIWAEKIYSEIWTNMFCTLENFFLHFWKMHFEILPNCCCNSASVSIWRSS